MVGTPIERLFARPGGFAPFAALRLLRRWLGTPAAGGARLRCSASTSMSPPEGELEVVRQLPAEDGEPPALEFVAAFGSLLGVHGALPAFYTEALLERRDPAPLAFLDLFQHRLAALAESVWRHGRPALAAETPAEDRLQTMLLAIAGHGHGHRRGDGPGGAPPAAALAWHGGTLGGGRPSAQAIEAVLAHQFAAPVRVEPWLGRWRAVPEAARGRLGLQGLRLGHDALAGSRCWQRDLDLRLVIGPLPRARLLPLLPGGDAAAALRAWWRQLGAGLLDAEVRLVMRAEDLRPARVGGPAAARLGFDAVLPWTGPPRDRADAGYRLSADPAAAAARGPS
ncbi:type VI secretion system baseplate subunit TssG [Rubrivivax sp. JA1026]|uniref:type VI secretion system baseplate subunit TssG n=1 Tax=Rubrivivax sp. JA1026 TaxID=2710888 RepID=UPI0013E99945|nr:type VI secretion system baseplate subunit TssG [Rubrivivax sp. JA1026]